MTLAIRPEQPPDHGSVRSVLESAFGQPHESRLVDALRDDPDCISLVAELDSQVVGHVFFTPVTVGSFPATALGPLAVRPDRQRRGIGLRLVRAGLEACRGRGATAVFVLGHPQYYPRFGFVPASGFGIRCAFPVPDELFFALELRPDALSDVQGTVQYHAAFSELEESS
jgi:putative acetyltransferase